MRAVTIRQFLRTSASFRNEVREVLQNLCIGEALLPSKCLWMVSPWLRDVELIDNRSGAFRAVAPEWPKGPVRLSHLVALLLDRGATVVVATREDPETQRLIGRFRETFAPFVKDGRLVLHERNQLHAKGLLADSFCLSGSMNFTYSGLEIQEELLTLQTDPAEIGKLRLDFQAEYGGVP